MLVLGFPDGSLSRHTKDLLEHAGMEMPPGFLVERRYLYPLSSKGGHPFGNIHIFRPQDMPLMIDRGTVDVGFSGQDWYLESGFGKVAVVANFNYSKALLKPPKIVVLGKKGGQFHDTEDTEVSTEYPDLARKRFKNAKIIVVKGKAESLLVGKNPVDFCVDLFDQGTTARINGLTVIGEPIIDSPTILLANGDSALLPEVKAFIDKLNIAFTELVD